MEKMEDVMNKWKRRYYKLLNLKSSVKWFLFSFKDSDLKRELQKNKEFKNRYAGKRCFVLGNGPSLKNVDLSLLADEYTFTVNQISRNPQFKEMKTNFHFWADPLFFEIDETKPEDLELLETMKGVKTENNSPVVFLPIEQKSFAKKYGLEDDLDIHYYKGGLVFLDSLKTIDYSKIVPGFYTVAQYCISMAICMGFSEIYLLGCDNTSIINNISAALKQDVENYAYDVSSGEQKRLENAMLKRSIYDFSISFSNVLRDYIQLYEYCNKHAIALCNCTEQSAIDTIPKVRLSDVLKKQVTYKCTRDKDLQRHSRR